MTTVRDLRKRIHAAQNIQQITKTMEMVAAARLRRAQTKAEQARPYAKKIRQMLENLAWTEGEHPLFKARPVKTIGVVVVSSDRGLCGSYNITVLASAEEFVREHAQQAVEVVPIGKKGVDLFHRRGAKIRTEIPKWDGKLTFAEVQALATELINGYLTGQLDEVWVIYTHFVNALQRYVQTDKLLPIEKPEHAKDGHPPSYIFEPDPSHIYDELLPHYVAVKIQTALNESFASELAARVFAMRTATKNAGEMIEDLTLLRNKVRQAGITKEMLEITSGAEGLK